MIGNKNLNEEQELLDDFTEFEISEMIKTVMDIREFVERDQFIVPLENVKKPSIIDQNILNQEEKNFKNEDRE